jgi:hypothetical protein
VEVLGTGLTGITLCRAVPSLARPGIAPAVALSVCSFSMRHPAPYQGAEQQKQCKLGDSHDLAFYGRASERRLSPRSVGSD